MLNLTGSSNTMLTFKRWLTVEQGQFDQATVKVNGTQVFINPPTSDLVDMSWVDMEIDIFNGGNGAI